MAPIWIAAQAADIAMYQVKAAGRNAWMFFESRMNEEVRTRHRLETDMRLALEHGQFELHFQPQFDIDGGRVIAWEALLRWNHPQRGWIEPTEFIPVAEETGMILPLGEWVLETACREAVAWASRRHGEERVAVNLSPRQFDHPGRRWCASSTTPACRTAGAEVTESALMANTPKVQEALRALKALGVMTSMISAPATSLGYLGSLPWIGSRSTAPFRSTWRTSRTMPPCCGGLPSAGAGGGGRGSKPATSWPS
jgi:predicted signal transduction protein with EAL and GGDEF domain